MAVVKHSIGDRDYWFSAEQVENEDPDTGTYCPTDRYYCVFSAREFGPLNRGELLKDQENRVRVFNTPNEAIAAGVREVQARLNLVAKFAVGLPYGNKDSEFQAYVRLLRELGIDLNKPRVGGSFGRQWLHAWDNRDDAERFATRLRKETHNPDWEVYEFSEPRPLGGDPDGQGPIDVLVGRQSNGWTYALHPNSLQVIRKHFPAVHPRPSIFLGRDAQSDYEVASGTRYDQIAVLLTGLSLEELAELGGYRIVDPITDLVLHETDVVPAGVNA